MENIANNKNCYACGVCAAICPQNIIKLELNEDGFYEPLISDLGKCVHCGLCMEICAFTHKDLAIQVKPIKSWGGWSNDSRIRQKCSSGGVSFEVGKQLIERGYKAVGCRYDINEQRAEHYIATSVKEFIPSIGSKYIQSYTVDAFKKIDRKQKYLIIGTPCQIDSFRRMIQKFHCEDNFVLMDFFCHCVPSMWAWKAYLKMLEPKIGRITYASWRNKFNYGWHDNWLMGIDGEKTSIPIDWHEDFDILIKEKQSHIKSRKSQGDLFYKLFLGDVCHGKQCEKNCKYKYDQSSADIRIGDLWGKTYSNDEKGVSAVVAFTEKGQSIISTLSDITLIEHPFEVVAEGQMKVPVHHKATSKFVMYLLKHNYPLQGTVFQSTFRFQQLMRLIRLYYNYYIKNKQ